MNVLPSSVGTGELGLASSEVRSPVKYWIEFDFGLTLTSEGPVEHEVVEPLWIPHSATFVFYWLLVRPHSLFQKALLK